MKVVFFGSGKFVNPVIQTLKKNFDLVQVVTPQTQFSEKADIGVIASYGKIVPKDTIESFPYGILNIHPSLLPKYRGPTPVQTSILNGDKNTGVTIIKIDVEVDHGPILAQKEIEISKEETSESLLKRTFKLGAKMLPEVISKYIKGQIKKSIQDDSKASFTQILKKEDGYIDVDNPPDSLRIDHMVRAYYPWPGVWTKLPNGKILKFLPDKSVQLEGKKVVSLDTFFRGYPQFREMLDFFQ